MRKLLFLIPVLLCVTACLGQNKFDPQVLVLAPKTFRCDASLQKEVDSINAALKAQIAEELTKMSADSGKINALEPNARLMARNDMAFLNEMGLSKQISLLAQNYLAYRFYEKFPNVLMLVSSEQSAGNAADMQGISTLHDQPYVLNFSDVYLYKENGIKYCRVKVQLYERQSNSLLVDKEYKGDWNNPGFEFACENGSIACTINNVLSRALADVIEAIAANNQTLKDEHRLAEIRFNYLRDSVYSLPFDKALITQAIAGNDKAIDLNMLYQCFYSSDKSKFVGFFIKTLSAKEAKTLPGEKSDDNVKVLTSKDISDSGYLDQRPHTYAYIVKGVLYQNKWYYKKDQVTYFDAEDNTTGKLQYLNNLQDWGYFADGTASPAANFWEAELFKKVEDKRKDPKWEQYKEMWADEEKENRPYIGLYEIVADQLKKNAELDNDAFRQQIIDGILQPFFNKQVKTNNIAAIDKLEQFNVIYPTDRQVVLSPVTVIKKDGSRVIRFFVVIPATKEVFEWTLPSPYMLKKDEFTDEPVTQTISKYTVWDYSYKTLDNQSFWNEKVLLKEGGEYKYLRRLQ